MQLIKTFFIFFTLLITQQSALADFDANSAIFQSGNNINIQGSNLSPTNNITLKADNDILLEAAKNTDVTKSNPPMLKLRRGMHRESFGRVGFNFGTKGVSISIDAMRSNSQRPRYLPWLYELQRGK